MDRSGGMLTTENPETEEKILRLIGLAMRAKKLACGREAANISIRKKKSKLLIIAKDCASRTLQDMERLTEHHNVPLLALSSMEELGRYTGTDVRACISVEDEGFSSGIRKYLAPTAE